MIFDDRRAHDALTMLAVVRNIAFNGPMFGQAPSLEAGENGVLYLRDEQVGIGRSPWSMTLTIVHSNERFLVAGQTCSTYDRILRDEFPCDVDLLTGDWEVIADRVDPETDEETYLGTNSGRSAGARLA